MSRMVLKISLFIAMLVIFILSFLLYKSYKRVSELERLDSGFADQADFIRIYELLDLEGIYNDNPTQEQINLQKVDSILGVHLHP
ncbi:MAG: hypothetical protein PUI58_01555 [Solobacterium sp.]|nr:hypothetical protein [Solobacterium sp.]